MGRSGSSPLTRGKLEVIPDVGAVVGLIPAHTGKTIVHKSLRLPPRAHPRSRGEKSCTPALIIIGRGSSPLTRGKRAGRRVHGGAAGLIPAHAGKTHWESPPARQRRAHPRSRGENSTNASMIYPGIGSSPLTRGKHAHLGCSSDQKRLIPAHSRKTSATMPSRRRRRAHPRSHRDNRMILSPALLSSGSSPLTRGKQDDLVSGLAVERLIPARARKTLRAIW